MNLRLRVDDLLFSRFVIFCQQTDRCSNRIKEPKRLFLLADLQNEDFRIVTKGFHGEKGLFSLCFSHKDKHPLAMP